MRDIWQLAREASAIILGTDGHEAYRHKNVSSIRIHHNNSKKPDACILIASYRNTRGKGQLRSDQMTKLANGASRYIHRGGGVGVFRNRLIAADNIPRFQLWVELGCPNMRQVEAQMSDAAERELKSRIAVHRLQVIKEKLEQQRRYKLKQQTRRRSLKAAERWREKAEELKRLAKALDEGVQQITHANEARLTTSPDGATRLEMTVSETADTAHMQHRLLMQCLAVRHYYRRLAERNEGKVANCELTAAAVDIVMGSAEDETESAEDAVIRDLLEDDAGDSTAHAIAEEVGQIFGFSGRTIRDRATEFAKEETFGLDLRGKTSPTHLLDDEDLKRRVTSFLAEKAHALGGEALTVLKFHEFVNDTLLKDLADDPKYQDILSRTLTKNAEGNYTICASTARTWMHRVGASREWFRSGTYTDVHEKPEVIESRMEYLKLNAELQLREPTWVQMPREEYESKRQQAGEAWRHSEAPHEYVDERGVEMVELHVDDFQDTGGVFWNERRSVSVRFKPPAAREPSQRTVERHNAAAPLARCPLGHSMTAKSQLFDSTETAESRSRDGMVRTDAHSENYGRKKNPSRRQAVPLVTPRTPRSMCVVSSTSTSRSSRSWRVLARPSLSTHTSC